MPPTPGTKETIEQKVRRVNMLKTKCMTSWWVKAEVSRVQYFPFSSEDRDNRVFDRCWCSSLLSRVYLAYQKVPKLAAFKVKRIQKALSTESLGGGGIL